MALGPGALADYELLALILARGTSQESAQRIARRALKGYGSGGLAGRDAVQQLCKLCGLGELHACKILACLELGRRFFHKTDGAALRKPEDVYKHLRFMAELSKEAFRGLYLDVKGRLIYEEIVSLGILTMNLVHPREVFRPAIERSAASIILAHNHPSGDPTPSPEDLRVTRQLVQVGRLMDIEVLDHVIIAREGFVSLKRRGLMGSQDGP
jgi:DNA repair protein RadC